MFIYLNSSPSRRWQAGSGDVVVRGLCDDAKARVRAEAGQCPYNFLESPYFAKARDRGMVTNTLVVRDRFASKGSVERVAAMTETQPRVAATTETQPRAGRGRGLARIERPADSG